MTTIPSPLFFTLKYKASQRLFLYFFKNFGFSLIVSFLFAIVANFFFPNGASSPYNTETSFWVFIWQCFFVVLFLPFLESFLLIYPTVISSSAINNQHTAAFVGALPIVLLHATDHWAKPFVVLVLFFVQAYSYIELRKNGFSFSKRFIFVWLLHAMNNLIAVTLYYFVQKTSLVG